jgi:hypothetical protein
MPDSHVDSVAAESGDPVEMFRKAFADDDHARVRRLFAQFPEYKSRINEPVAAFDAPVLTTVRSREMLEVLLEAGADINAKSRWWAGGFGLLHCAEPELAAYAIQRGASVDVHAAARLGLSEKLRELVAADPTLVHARGGDGQTPLHFAGTIEIARFLLEQGADMDARDLDHESTPAQHMIRDRQEIARYLIGLGCAADLLLAAALGEVDLARQLLEADPDRIRLRVNDECFPKGDPRSGGTIYQWTLGWQVSPHDVARQFGHLDLLRLLLERSPPEVSLLDACWTADEPALASILAKHEGLVGRLSATMLRQVAHAARNNHIAAVRSMLSIGFPVDALGQHRATPLHWAAFHGHAEMTREILRHQPPLELKDADFQASPLGWAIHGSVHGWYCRTGDYPATVALLLEAGARPPDRLTGGTEAVRAVLRRAENHRSP